MKIEIGKTYTTVYGETVKVLDAYDNCVWTDKGIYHITKIQLSTAK